VTRFPLRKNPVLLELRLPLWHLFQQHTRLQTGTKHQESAGEKKCASGAAVLML